MRKHNPEQKQRSCSPSPTFAPNHVLDRSAPSTHRLHLLSLFAFRSAHGGGCQYFVGRVKITCNDVPDDGRSLEDHLRVMSADGTPLEEAAEIIVQGPRGNISINENTLALFPNLTVLILYGPSDSQVNESRSFLDIHPRAFRHTPALEEMRIQMYNISDDTVRAIASLKDQLGLLSLLSVQAADEYLSFVVNFARLWRFNIERVCIGNLVPSVLLAKSAANIKELSIGGCPPPSSKITNRMFSNMPNLVLVEWTYSNISEIEAESFDSNPKLEVVKFCDNRIQSLPNGLFSPLAKLRYVNFKNNVGLRDLWKSNFTLVEEFVRSFVLKL